MPHVAIHALLDGRDTLPRSALGFMEQLLDARERARGGRVASADATTAWTATGAGTARSSGIDAMVQGVGPRAPDPARGHSRAYERGESDEFMKPVVIERNGEPVAPIRDGDAIICFNFRADRMRQIVRALTRAGLRRLRRPRAPAVTRRRR